MNTIGPLIATKVELSVPESGTWVLDVDHDLPLGAVPPTGKTICLVGGVPFVGTVDPTASGAFGTRARCRVVGAIEWRKSLPKRDFANPAALLSSVVISATAAELGIPAVVAAIESLGTNYVRVAGPASQVLGRSGWWVGPDGITTVGPRLPSLPGLDFGLVSYDALDRVAKARSSTPIMPGMVIADLSLPGGAMRVREVFQTWTDEGSVAELWMGEVSGSAVQGPRLANAIQSLAVAAIRPEVLTHHVYTVVGQKPSGEYLLQAEVKGPVPDALPVLQWPGVPGFSCKVKPGSKVLVGFRGKEPVVLGFDDSGALTATWDYTLMSLGGDAAKPVVTEVEMTTLLTMIAALQAQCAAYGAAIAALVPGTGITDPSPFPLKTAAASAASAGVTAITTGTTAINASMGLKKTWAT